MTRVAETPGLRNFSIPIIAQQKEPKLRACVFRELTNNTAIRDNHDYWLYSPY